MTDRDPDRVPERVRPELERRARRRWTLFIIGFFVLQAILWVFALRLVHNDPSHAVVEDYDRLAVSWDRQRARLDASAALGWNANVDFAAGSLEVHITDRDAQAVTADRVVATVFHQATAANRQTIELVAAAPGVYVGPSPVDRVGKWRVEIDARRDGDVFLDTQVREVLAEEAP